ncbi:MAG: hypothetical protein ACI9S9_001790 [Planctomycetota bacterium]|jgi:hypothetical protein
MMAINRNLRFATFVLAAFGTVSALRAQISQGAEPDIELVRRFDEDDNKRLDRDERKAARAYILAHPELRPPARKGRPPKATGSEGLRVTVKDVKNYPATTDLFAPDCLRTLFFEFDQEDWEEDLAAFWHTDVLVAANLTVDGKTYQDVGVSFRGNNSFTGVPAGLKRSLSLKMHFVHDQDLFGHRSINLLNSNEDPTFLRTVLYLEVARDYIPAVRANFLRVVINGELWGIYVNQETFSREFEKHGLAGPGTRWKSPNNSLGGGMDYLGDDINLYKRWYEIKGRDDKSAWRALRDATKVLCETPAEQLLPALDEHWEVDSVLRYLAIDMALLNYDGYWRDGSDFYVYRNAKGRFLATPHDANEGFRVRPRRDGSQPDPLTACDDSNKALRHRLLAVPELRRRYLSYVGDIAEKWLDWQHLGPIVAGHQQLIAKDVARETRKLDTTEAFTTGVHGARHTEQDLQLPATTIKGFAAQRRAFLLGHPEVQRARKQ